jgi:hyaluronoglucosaminidase
LPSYGIIEGYWGPAWSIDTRVTVLHLMKDAQLDYYTFGPKSCVDLRLRWREGISSEVHGMLRVVAEECHGLGISFGIMISPLGFMSLSPADLRDGLRRAGRSLAEIAPGTLTVAFDDMQEEALGVPLIQARIARELFERSGCKQRFFCPTTYSGERLRRAAAAGYGGYLERVAAALPPKTVLFWTGERSINNEIASIQVDQISDIIERRPALWWNFPANDGYGFEDRLRLTPMLEGLRELSGSVPAIHFNPMNEGLLSVIALTASLNYVRGRCNTPAGALEAAMAALLPDRLRRLLAEDLGMFEREGRNLSSSDVLRLLRRYDGLRDSAYVRELLGWLNSRDDRNGRSG